MPSHHPLARRQTPPATTSTSIWLPRVVILLAVAGMLALGAWFILRDGSGTTPANSTAAGKPLPIPNRPQTVLGLRVDEPAIDRGRLPLDTTVTQLYEITNTGTAPAEFGKPTIEVLEGCCPPQVQMTQMLIEAGQTVSVGFSTQMHEGMDGPHLFHLTVPFRTAEGDDALHLYFKGDFGG